MMILLKFMVERYFYTKDEFKLNIEQEIVGNNTKEVVESTPGIGLRRRTRITLSLKTTSF